MYDQVRRGGRRVIAVGVLLCVALAGCGGGPSAQDSARVSAQKSAQEWAGRVCSALTPWRARIAELNAATQRQMATTTTPADTQTHLVDLMAGGEAASETARVQLAAAAAPQVAGGADVAARMVASLGKSRDAYAQARSTLQGLPTADPAAFYAGVVAALRRLTDDYAAGAVDLSTVNSPELRAAFDNVGQCQ